MLQYFFFLARKMLSALLIVLQFLQSADTLHAELMMTWVSKKTDEKGKVILSEIWKSTQWKYNRLVCISLDTTVTRSASSVANLQNIQFRNIHATYPVMADEMNRVYPSDKNFIWTFTLGALVNKDKCSERRTGVKACTLQIKPVVADKLNPLKHLWNVDSQL